MKTVALTIVCIALVFGGAITGFLFALSTIRPGPSSVFPEYLVLSEPEYGGSGNWFVMTVNNTGISAVKLVKVLVNNVKQSSTDPLLPIDVAPDNGLMLIVMMNLSQGLTYQIDLFTSQGNKFSKVSEFPSGGHQPGITLYVANSNFYNVWGVKRIGIDIGNSGTTDMSILRLYIGSSASTLENQTITATTLNHGEIVRLTVTYDWTGDSTYFFKVISASGQSLAWSEQAPADEREEISITNMAFQTGTPGSILVVANNTGTSSVTINEIWVNNQKQNTISPTIPTNGAILANQGLAFNITMTINSGYSYQVKLVSSKGNAFLYTGTAPT